VGENRCRHDIIVRVKQIKNDVKMKHNRCLVESVSGPGRGGPPKEPDIQKDKVGPSLLT